MNKDNNMNNTEVMENEAVEVETTNRPDYAGAGVLGLAIVGGGTILYWLFKGIKKLFGFGKKKVEEAKAKKAEKSETEESSEEVTESEE